MENPKLIPNKIGIWECIACGDKRIVDIFDIAGIEAPDKIYLTGCCDADSSRRKYLGTFIKEAK